MISIYRWNPQTRQGQWEELPSADSLASSGPPADEVWWIDLEDPSAEEEQLIFEAFFKVHALTLEDITKPRRESVHHFPKVEEFAEYLFVIVNPLHPSSLRPRTAGGTKSATTHCQLSAVLTRSLLITHHYAPLPSVGTVKQFLFRHPDGGARITTRRCRVSERSNSFSSATRTEALAVRITCST